MRWLHAGHRISIDQSDIRGQNVCYMISNISIDQSEVSIHLSWSITSLVSVQRTTKNAFRVTLKSLSSIFGISWRSILILYENKWHQQAKVNPVLTASQARILKNDSPWYQYPHWRWSESRLEDQILNSYQGCRLSCPWRRCWPIKGEYLGNLPMRGEYLPGPGTELRLTREGWGKPEKRERRPNQEPNIKMIRERQNSIFFARQYHQRKELNIYNLRSLIFSLQR